MTPHGTTTALRPLPAREALHPHGSPLPSVLIQVPVVRGRTGRRVSVSRTRPRRRLRKEVRLVGSILLAAVTTTFGVIGLTQGLQPSSPSRGAGSSDGIDDAPVISLSLEPIGGSSSMEVAAPVVRPAGYVLPDDGTEEGSHAGS